MVMMMNRRRRACEYVGNALALALSKRVWILWTGER